MQLLVLGMHRSGTSAVTRLLNLAGAYFGPEGIATEPNEENPKGFWERRDVRAVCDGLLHGGGFDWWKLVGFDPAALPAEVLEEGLDGFRSVLDDLDGHRPWVLKEPRLCVLAPVLLPLLDAPVVVHVAREPLEVARSMHQRDGFPVQAALALWELYTVRAFEASTGLPRLIVHHEELLADPVATTRKLVEDLSALGVEGLTAPSDDEVLGFVSGDLHRQRADRSLRHARLNQQQAELAAAVDDAEVLVPGAVPPVSDGAWDELAELEAARDQAARLRQHELDLASAQRHLANAERRLAEAERRAELDRASAERHLANAQRRHQESERRAELDLASVTRRLERDRDTELARRRELGRQAELALRTTQRQLERLEASRVGRIAAQLVTVRQTLTPGASRTSAGPFTVPLSELGRARRDLEALTQQDPAPGGTSAVLFATDDPLIQRTTPRRSARSTDRPSIAVISWDVGHNPLGRANVLAEVLARHADVELWGAQFERYGSQIWPPLRRTSTPINVFEGRRFPEHLASMERVASHIDADAIWVSKPRLPSYLLGIDAKLARNRPLVLDVDDHELSFFAEDEGLTLEELDAWSRKDLQLPFERGWTRLCDSYIDAADAVTVSNVALQARYGGLIVPHARDERVFDPARVDPEAVRARLGIPEGERLLLFGGTPRVHKGVVEILEALERLGDDRYRVLMFGTKEFDDLKDRIGETARWARVLEPVPFAELPSIVGIADLACVLQDPDHPVSPYQLPAKVFDALAMGVPCLVTATPPLAPLVDAGVLQVLQPGEALHERIAAIFGDLGAARERAARGRQLFLDEYSYEAVGRQVLPLFDGLIADPPPPSPRLVELAEAPARIMATSPTRPKTAAPAPRPTDSTGRRPRLPRREAAEVQALAPGVTFDVVVFWKQNDSGIYGRRQDMLVEELSRSPRVGTIVHFDDPRSPEELVVAHRAGSGAADQRRLVVRQTLARMAHRLDEPNLYRHTFLYGGSRSRRLGLPHRGQYANHVRKVLRKHGVGSRPLLLWAYPTNSDLPALIDALDPALVVADVVDDNRSWYEPDSPRAVELGENYRAVLGRSDVVLANCEPVAEAMAAYAPAVHVVPNGCELPTGAPAGPMPEVARGLGHPLLAYVGNLSSRLDLGLVRSVAEARPDWTIALVGSAHLDRSVLELDALANVHLLGVMPYRQVRDFLAHVDVGLIPHEDNEMTRSMNPLKAFVYASAGVPVVATPVANLPDFGDLITIARGPDEFVAAIDAHLAAGRPTVDVELLRPHSWQARVAQVFDLIDAELAPDEG
jgi:glycosyltransferase involved in cell wall biosynthesis